MQDEVIGHRLKKILLVEDEPHLAFNLEYNLKASGYDIYQVDNGVDALAAFREHGPFDLMILDIMIPELNGFDVAQHIRQSDKHIGILMLTARATEEDIIQGFSHGADDYLTKPFRLNELMSRIKRMAERSELLPNQSRPLETNQQILQVDAVSLNLETFQVESPAGFHQLTPLEAKVLAEFLHRPGQVLSREHLLQHAWGIHGNVETRTVDNFILRLRRCLEIDPTKPQILQSVRSRGYRFNRISLQ